MPATLISIVGPPAAGKTTLAEALAARLDATVLYEDYAGNPFIADAYAGRHEADLPGQLYFLNSRVAQLSELSWPPGGTRISDYGFCQDRLFARLLLATDEFVLYDHLAQRLARLVHPPDVVVHIDTSERTLLDRIARRGRDFEQSVTAGFLAQVRRAFAEAVAGVACPVIAVNGDTTDLRTSAALDELVAALQQQDIIA